MTTLLYIIWFIAPAIFFIMAFWSQLEKWSGRSKQGEVGTYIKQGIFLLVCALVCVIIDKNFLEDLVNSLLDPIVSLQLAQIVLFPLVLLIAAQLTGGSKPIQLHSKRVDKSQRKKR